MWEQMSKGEQAKASRIIRKAIAMGLLVSVEDGEGGWEVKCSTSYDQIMDAVGNMELDYIRFRNADRSQAGAMMLVWGNAPDGSELAADYTDNEVMRQLAEA